MRAIPFPSVAALVVLSAPHVLGAPPNCRAGAQPGTDVVPEKSSTETGSGPRQSFLCTYEGSVSGLTAAITIEYECPDAEQTWLGKGRRNATLGERGGMPFIMKLEGGPNDARQFGKMILRVDRNTIATIAVNGSSEEGRLLGWVRHARDLARANVPPASSIGCAVGGGSPPAATASASSEPEPAGECTLDPKTWEPKVAGGVPVVSGGFEFQVPKFPDLECFGDSLTIAGSAEAHDVDGDGCTRKTAVTGTVQNCVEAFCTKDCWTASAGGGRELVAAKECENPPRFSCSNEKYCDKKSVTFGLERSTTLKPSLDVGFWKTKARCGLELTAAVNGNGSLNRWTGTTCSCASGGWAGTVRVGATLSGSASCSVKLFGREWEVPSPQAEGCFNFGLVHDSAGCVPGEQAGGGHSVVGGAAIKLKTPPIQIKWLKIAATAILVEIPKGKGTGCSGATDL